METMYILWYTYRQLDQYRSISLSKPVKNMVDSVRKLSLCAPIPSLDNLEQIILTTDSSIKSEHFL